MVSLGQTFSISLGAHDKEVVRPHKTRGLHAPPLPIPSDLTASVKQLVLSIGRSVCNRTAPVSLIMAQMRASLAAVSSCCDFSGGDLRVTSTMAHLNETKRNAIAHDLGVGLAGLIMQDMGYAWAGLAEDHVDPKPANGFKSKKRPDMIFDSGRGVQEYIAVEAKGSTPFANGWVSANLTRRLRNACTGQVANVLGASSIDGSLISRGLASGFLGIAGGPAGTYRVTEAESSVVPSRPLSGASAAVSFPDGHSPMPLIALRHYIGVLGLVGGHHTAQRLLRQLLSLTDREEQILSAGDTNPIGARTVSYFERRFVVGEPLDLPSLGWNDEYPNLRFGISVDVLNFLLARMMNVSGNVLDERVTIPTEQLSSVYFETRGSTTPNLVDFDGLALFSDIDFEEEETIEI